MGLFLNELCSHWIIPILFLWIFLNVFYPIVHYFHNWIICITWLMMTSNQVYPWINIRVHRNLYTKFCTYWTVPEFLKIFSSNKPIQHGRRDVVDDDIEPSLHLDWFQGSKEPRRQVWRKSDSFWIFYVFFFQATNAIRNGRLDVIDDDVTPSLPVEQCQGGKKPPPQVWRRSDCFWIKVYFQDTKWIHADVYPSLSVPVSKSTCLYMYPSLCVPISMCTHWFWPTISLCTRLYVYSYNFIQHKRLVHKKTRVSKTSKIPKKKTHKNTKKNKNEGIKIVVKFVLMVQIPCTLNFPPYSLDSWNNFLP
jgi:hypothetical protein